MAHDNVIGRATTDRAARRNVSTRSWLDRLVGVVSPSREAARVAARIRTQTMLRAYDGAAGGRRFDGWPTPSTSADAEIGLSLARLRARCRDLSRNNPHAKRAVTVWTTNLVGDGIVPRAWAIRARWTCRSSMPGTRKPPASPSFAASDPRESPLRLWPI